MCRRRAAAVAVSAQFSIVGALLASLPPWTDYEGIELDMDESLLAEPLKENLAVEADHQWWQESRLWVGYSRWQVHRWYCKRTRSLDFPVVFSGSSLCEDFVGIFNLSPWV